MRRYTLIEKDYLFSHFNFSFLKFKLQVLFSFKIQQFLPLLFCQLIKFCFWTSEHKTKNLKTLNHWLTCFMWLKLIEAVLLSAGVNCSLPTAIADSKEESRCIKDGSDSTYRIPLHYTNNAVNCIPIQLPLQIS